MKLFSQLVNKLGASTKTNEKLGALATYFSEAPNRDKVWVIALFSGRRPRRIVSGSLLSQWCIEIADLPPWLFNECYHTVGDLADTIALLLPQFQFNDTTDIPQLLSLSDYVATIVSLEKAVEEDKKAFVTGCWKVMNKEECFVFNKLLTGSFRIGVSQKMIVNALAKNVQVSPSVIAHRISGNWNPATTSFEELLCETETGTDHSKPYPFYLAYALENNIAELGNEKDWQAEWKWDGIRGQIIKRNG